MKRSLRCALIAASMALPAAGAAAQPAPDAGGIWTLQDENARLSAARLTDHFYTNGLRAGWTSPAGQVPDLLATIGRSLLGDGEQRVGFGLTQVINTPSDTRLVTPDPHDQPYAGLLTANLTLLNDTATTRDVLVLNLGLAGPDAQGERVQNGFHHLIGHPDALGWNAQIPDTPAFGLLRQRTWRIPLGPVSGPITGLEADLLPELSAVVGDIRDDVQAGATLRLGQGLGSDFGVPRIRPGVSGEDAYAPTRPFAWYVFAGANAQAVAYDLLLEAAPFRSGPHVAPLWDVAEFQTGIAVMVHGVRLTAAYVIQTPTFVNQRGGLHQFCSLSLSVRF